MIGKCILRNWEYRFSNEPIEDPTGDLLWPAGTIQEPNSLGFVDFWQRNDNEPATELDKQGRVGFWLFVLVTVRPSTARDHPDVLEWNSRSLMAIGVTRGISKRSIASGRRASYDPPHPSWISFLRRSKTCGAAVPRKPEPESFNPHPL